MSAEELIEELGLDQDADYARVEAAFTEDMKQHLQRVAEHYSEEGVKEEEAQIKTRFTAFFSYARVWLSKEIKKHDKSLNVEAALRVKKEAAQNLAALESYLISYASCYVHLNYFMRLVRDEIRNEEGKSAALAARGATGGAAGRVKWTPDSGVMIARYRKEKLALVAHMQRMQQARDILQQAESRFESLRAALMELCGKEKAEVFLRSITAGLRTLSHKKLQDNINAIKKTKPRFGLDQKQAQEAVQGAESSILEIERMITDNRDILEDEEGRYFLHQAEAERAYNTDIRDMQKMQTILGKYHLPYMQYKLDGLAHLKDKLLVINTLDSLMVLYRRLIIGLVRPMTDIKTVRLYESEVINHVQYLLTGHFTELPKIMQRAEDTVNEFRVTVDDIEEITALQLEEIPAQASG